MIQLSKFYYIILKIKVDVYFELQLVFYLSLPLKSELIV